MPNFVNFFTSLIYNRKILDSHGINMEINVEKFAVHLDKFKPKIGASYSVLFSNS